MSLLSRFVEKDQNKPAPAKTPVDPLSNLPKESIAKLERLRTEADDAHSLAYGPYERAKGLREVRQNLELQLSEARGRERLREDHPKIIGLLEKLEANAKEFARYSAMSEERRYRASSFGRLADRAEEYAKSLGRRGDKVSYVAPATISVKSEALQGELIKVRARIDTARETIRSVKAAPILAEDARAIVSGFVTSLAASGTPEIYPVIDDGRMPVLPTIPVSNTGITITDATAFLFWAFKDEIKKKLFDEIALHADDAAALSDQQRATALEKTKKELLALERSEEAVIEKLIEQGVAVDRREDMDIRALLGFPDSAPAPRGD